MNLLGHRQHYNPYGLKAYGCPLTRTETKAYFCSINITSEELADLNEWVKDGYKFFSNPWHIYDGRGDIVNFVEGSRSVKYLHEEHMVQSLVPPSPITGYAFMLDHDLPF